MSYCEALKAEISANPGQNTKHYVIKVQGKDLGPGNGPCRNQLLELAEVGQVHKHAEKPGPRSAVLWFPSEAACSLCNVPQAPDPTEALLAAVAADPGRLTMHYAPDKADRLIMHELADEDRLHKHAQPAGKGMSWWPSGESCKLCNPPQRAMVNKPQGEAGLAVYLACYKQPGKMSKSALVGVIKKEAWGTLAKYDPDPEDLPGWIDGYERSGRIHRHSASGGYFHDSRCFHDDDCVPVPPTRF